MKRMAMEGRLRKPHRQNRSGFSRRIAPDHTCQQVSRHINGSTDPRLRWSSKHMLPCWIIMGAGVTRLSLADALRAIRRAMERVRNGMPCPTLGEKLLEAAGKLALPVCDEYVRRSSKQARDWPHKKSERPPGCPRLRRLKGSEKARVYAVLTNHAAQLT